MKKYPTAAGMDPEDAARALMSRMAKKPKTNPSGQNQTLPPQGGKEISPGGSPQRESEPSRWLEGGDLVTIVQPDGSRLEGYRVLPGGVDWEKPPDGEE